MPPVVRDERLRARERQCAEVLRMYLRGHSLNACASYASRSGEPVTVETARLWVRRAGIERGARPHRALSAHEAEIRREQRARALQLAGRGLPFEALLERVRGMGYDVPERTVRRWLRSAGEAS